jgi:antitoxin (DNA-binding transcriptional repressor) of toxin-antitoxin stability system
MKTATVRDLRNRFALLSRWLEKGETIEILKRGKPVAELVPKAPGISRTLLGCTPSPVPVSPDLDTPVDADWEAMQ